MVLLRFVTSEGYSQDKYYDCMKYGKIYGKILLILIKAIPILVPIQHSSGVSSCSVSTHE